MATFRFSAHLLLLAAFLCVNTKTDSLLDKNKSFILSILAEHFIIFVEIHQVERFHPLPRFPPGGYDLQQLPELPEPPYRVDPRRGFPASRPHIMPYGIGVCEHFERKMIVARRFPQAEYHVRIVRGRQVMIPPRRRGLPFAHEDHRKVFRPDHEIIAPQVGDALPNLLIGIVVRASVYSVLLPVGRIMQARIAGMEKFVLHGQRHGHIRQQFAHQSDHLCPGMVFLKNEQVATLDKQPEQLRRRKTLRAPFHHLPTIRRVDNRVAFGGFAVRNVLQIFPPLPGRQHDGDLQPGVLRSLFQKTGRNRPLGFARQSDQHPDARHGFQIVCGELFEILRRAETAAAAVQDAEGKGWFHSLWLSD